MGPAAWPRPDPRMEEGPFPLIFSRRACMRGGTCCFCETPQTDAPRPLHSARYRLLERALLRHDRRDPAPACLGGVLRVGATRPHPSGDPAPPRSACLDRHCICRRERESLGGCSAEELNHGHAEREDIDRCGHVLIHPLLWRHVAGRAEGDRSCLAPDRSPLGRSQNREPSPCHARSAGCWDGLMSRWTTCSGLPVNGLTVL